MLFRSAIAQSFDVLEPINFDDVAAEGDLRIGDTQRLRVAVGMGMSGWALKQAIFIVFGKTGATSADCAVARHGLLHHYPNLRVIVAAPATSPAAWLHAKFD